MKTLEDIILDAYREGVFPMAEDANDEDFAFYKPHMRALIPIDRLHVPASLAKTLRRKKFRMTLDKAFEQVIDGCAASTPKRSNTWINAPIKEIFLMLHHKGHAHSVECWDDTGTLAGGLYGLAIGRVFCGESMFSLQQDASKVALVGLCALLKATGFKILDSQFMNPHLLQFGAYEIPQENYTAMIAIEMKAAPDHPLANVPISDSLLNDYLRSLPKP